jgi:hypothetical protein
VPAQRPHPPLPIDGIIFIYFWQLPDNENVLEPAFMPFADRLFSIAIEFQRHHPVAEDAFAPPTRVVAALCDVSSDRSLFAVGCGLDVPVWRGWELVEVLF